MTIVWKRALATATAAVAATVLFAACGGDDEPTLSVVAPEWLRPFMGVVDELYDAADLKFRYLDDETLAQEVRSDKEDDVVIAPAEVLPSAQAYPGLYESVRGIGSDQLVMVLRRGQKKLPDSFDVADDKGVRLAGASENTQLGRLVSSGTSSLKPMVEQRVQANITRRERSSAAVLRAVRTGSVDAGFVLESDVNRRPTGIKIIFLPKGMAQDASWQAGVRKKGTERDAARALVDSMFDGETAKQLRSRGLPSGLGQPGKIIPAS